MVRQGTLEGTARWNAAASELVTGAGTTEENIARRSPSRRTVITRVSYADQEERKHRSEGTLEADWRV